jgi:hypothetical protein
VAGEERLGRKERGKWEGSKRVVLVESICLVCRWGGKGAVAQISMFSSSGSSERSSMWLEKRGWEGKREGKGE